MAQHLVFVYGTLRRGESNHGYLTGSQYLGEFMTEPVYGLYDLGAYPGLVAGEQSVKGEVFAVDDTTLMQLDMLEEVPVEYRRERLATPFGLAWFYVFQDESLLTVSIDSGDWCQRDAG